MLPILTAKQSRRIDTYAIEHCGVPSIELMETAGRGAYEFLEQVCIQLKKNKVLILCGKGNNGGDGYVLARYLLEEWGQAKVVSTHPLKELSKDAAHMARQFKKAGGKIITAPPAHKLTQEIMRSDILVDALLGTGLQKKLRDPYGRWIKQINESGKPTLALDIPSGLNATTGKSCGVIVHATWTATMSYWKLGMLLSPGYESCGHVQVIDIGLPAAAQKQLKSNYRLITADTIHKSFPPRHSESHKNNYGHALIVAGSKTKLGAALMTAKSTLRVGAGLATLALPENVYQHIPTSFLELMYEPLSSIRSGHFASAAAHQLRKIWEGKTVLALGPGIGVNAGTRHLVRQTIKNSPIPLVIDADGINCLQDQKHCLQEALSSIVLTPHPGEMSRLLGISSQKLQSNRLEYASQFSKEFKVSIVLKGHHTICAFPDGRTYINPTGNPAMATAGTGDVLTGMITGLLSQGIEWKAAITSAVYIHGLAGDRLAERMGDRGLLAGDIIDSLPFIMKDFIPKRQKIYKSI